MTPAVYDQMLTRFEQSYEKSPATFRTKEYEMFCAIIPKDAKDKPEFSELLGRIKALNEKLSVKDAPEGV
ncbi:MAG: hypothetical protein KDK48_05280 [Chlamydiia bacterium]|nr:hypothetical protein [Chlamydiia bacterium]